MLPFLESTMKMRTDRRFVVYLEDRLLARLLDRIRIKMGRSWPAGLDEIAATARNEDRSKADVSSTLSYIDM